MSMFHESPGMIKNVVVTEVPEGSTAVLECNSNDFDHNFMFWLYDKNKVIGPGNPLDEQKYKYEVLSGKLHIDNVSPQESGFYKCISKKLDGTSYSVGEIEMLVSGGSFSAMDGVKLVAIVVSIIVIISCAVLYWRLRKDWKRYEGRVAIPVDDTEDDDGEDIYNPTTTTTPISPHIAGPKRNLSSEHLIYGIDNQGLDTDFNSVFENIQIKSPTPQRSLI